MITVDLRRVGIRPGVRILDVGCGSGRHMGETVRRPDTLTLGTDIRPRDLSDARLRMDLLEEMGEVRGAYGLAAADILALPFRGGVFDVVICSEVLEHVPDHRGALLELVRVLKPGGRIAISVPSYLPEKICWMLSRAYRSSPGGHIRIYRRRHLESLLADSGVSLRGGHGAHSLHAPYWWLKCLLGPGGKDRLPVRLYHRFLVWDMMQHPRTTRFLGWLLNPLLGKSLVVYGVKKRRIPLFPLHRKGSGAKASPASGA